MLFILGPLAVTVQTWVNCGRKWSSGWEGYMENPSSQQDSDADSPVIGHTQASSEGDARTSVQEPSSQEGKSKAGLSGLQKSGEK